MSDSKNHTINREYWEKNIEKYAGFYYVNSEENLDLPFGLSFFYKKFFFPMERKITLKRYKHVCAYIDKHVKEGMKVVDIGCGSGIFSQKMLEKGAKVYAFDYTKSAVELTKKNLMPDGKTNENLEVSVFDITEKSIPKVDLAISIGVLPYIDEVDKYFGNILPNTDKFLFNYIDKNNIFNLTRRILSVLDVRSYSYHSKGEIKSLIESRGVKIAKNTPLGTGFILDLEK